MKLINRWKKVAKKIAGIQADIFLFIIFFLIIFPLSVLLKLFFRNTLQEFFPAERKTYWIKKESINQYMNWAKLQ